MSSLVRFERKYWNPSDTSWRFSEDYWLDSPPRIGDVVTVEGFQGTVVEVKYAVRSAGRDKDGHNLIMSQLFSVLLG